MKVSSFDSPAKIITITSSIHGEGKSDTTANLAAAIAYSRRRVLLIDADMRKPVQHQLWNIDNNVGLSHFLSEKSGLEEAIHQLSPYLSVMTAGITVAEPSLFFESSQMIAMLNQIRENYDYIIFDAAPILPEPDVIMLGQVSEGVIFVSQPKYVRKTDVEAASRLLDKTKLPVIGLIVNRVSHNEQQENRAPFSHAYRIAEDSIAYQGGGENVPDSGDTPLKTSVDKVFSNSGSSSRG